MPPFPPEVLLVQRLFTRRVVAGHLATVVGVLLITAALAPGPLGKSPQPINGSPAALSAEQSADAEASAAEAHPPDSLLAGSRAAGREDVIPSSRGGREWDGSSDPPVSGGAPPPPTLPFPTPLAPTDQEAPSPPSSSTPSQPPGAPARVGIQAGHWKNSELPAELAGLRGSTGAAGNGWREVDINLDIARRVAALLQKENIQVDLIPATVPPGYKADAFVSLHGDANSNTSLSGYKLARSRMSSIPARDDALLAAISEEYAKATGLKEHRATITVNMTAYYSFAHPGIEHSVAPTTPSVILEMGFLTTLGDRKLLMEQPDRAAEGIAKGILKFLGAR